MSDPLAFLLTFRAYGTWLHGDERGSVDREHNAPGSPLSTPSADRRLVRTLQCGFPPMVFDDVMRRVVEAAFRDQCAHRRWELPEVNVRTNHAHLVVGFAGIQPERMMLELKGRATRWLRERGLIAPERPVWVVGAGSRRYLWKPEHITAACDYVRDGQDAEPDR